MKWEENIIEDLIDDVLASPKYPDGTLRDSQKIIDKYLDNGWEKEFEDEIYLIDDDYE